MEKQLDPPTVAGAEGLPTAMEEQFDRPTVILDDSLWISGSPIDYAWLQEHGINLVVDVADPELRLERDRLGPIVYCKEALVDGPELPAAAIIDRLVRDVVTAVREGRRVLVACAGGRNRSGLVVALAVRDILGCSGAEAMQLVQSRRESALNNVTFAEHLAGLARPETINLRSEPSEA
jgi:protein-tyrosine phosphatase